MCRCIVVLFLLAACEPLAAHPPLCTEDSHCAENFFCGSLYICNKCLDCRELNRSPPQQQTCLKSDAECGPCNEGWILDESYSGSANCVLAATKTWALTKPFYVWVTVAGVAIGILITIVFLHIFQSTSIFKIVHYHIPLNAVEKWSGIAKTVTFSQACRTQKLQEKESRGFVA